MKFIYRFTIGTFLLLSLFACEKENNLLKEGEMLFLKNKGASMPILVRGNFDSDVILLILHGGAGGTSANHIEDFSGLVEAEYLVAYWEQRHAGSAQGSFDKEDLSIEQMAEDMQHAISLLKHKYGADKKVFAVGHSWGVILGTYYLIEEESQLAGAIFSNGAHSSEHEYSARMDYIRDFAQEMIDKGLSMPESLSVGGEEFNSLADVVQWCDTNDPIGSWDQLEIQVQLVGVMESYVQETYFQQPDAIGNVSSRELNFQSPYNGIAAYINQLRTAQLINNFNNRTSIQEFYDFTPKMRDLTLPVCLIWGKYDPIVGLEVAEDYYEVIATPESDKELVVLENSGHSGLYRENIAYSQSLIAFVEKHR
ncbi:MAG: alpha/beta hydrolase [Bacteroidota bacterium]